MASEYAIAPLEQYASRLLEQIDAFDIEGVLHLLGQFEVMREQIRQQIRPG